jgi:hypothetical protein
MAGALDGNCRFPALELVFSRGRAVRIDAASANHLRFALFGIEPDGVLPVAALTHVSDRKNTLQNDYFWLRSDPVTLRVDMTQVFMTSHGFADLDPYERKEIENCVRSVMQEEGIDFHSDHPERWCIALKEPLEFDFTPLDETLGMNLADVIPKHPRARFWRRILNEIQVALHNCPVNIARRQSGKQEINSVWFWGGGFIPDAAPRVLIDTVCSGHPVTRGLAIINDCRLKPQNSTDEEGFSREGSSILIDWQPVSRHAVEELQHLEVLASQLLILAGQGRIALTLFDGSGEGRFYDRRARHRFWRRRAPLASTLPLSARV